MQASGVHCDKRTALSPQLRGGTLVISGKLRELRDAAGLTQRALANRAGVTVNTVSELERGENDNPTLGVLKALAVALGVPVTALFEQPATTEGRTATS